MRDTTTPDDRYDGVTPEEAQEIAEEIEDRPDWRTAKPWRGQAGWGTAIDHTGAFWTNMGRAWYGPYETEDEAQAILDAEERA
jgi:hypothetical protein